MRVRWSTLSWSAYMTRERVDVVALALRSWRRRSCPWRSRPRLRRDSSPASGHGDSAAGSAQCPNRRCRIRDRPSARPRRPSAMRGTRTNAGTASRGRNAFALPACTTFRNAPCRACCRPLARSAGWASETPIAATRRLRMMFHHGFSFSASRERGAMQACVARG